MKHFILPVLFLIALIGAVVYGPVPQDLNYHDFADDRMKFGIPYFFDTMTNLAFLIPGFWGLMVSLKAHKGKPKMFFITLFTGFILLAFGSGYYHLNPGNFRLVLDRIPIAIIIMAFFSFIIYDFVGKKIGKQFFYILLTVGIASVLYWHVTEETATGDLRPYLLVQFFPIIAIPLIIFLYRKPVDYLLEIVLIFLFFIMAKVAESFDEEIYNQLKVASGHNLKHVFMAVAGIIIVFVAKKRLRVRKKSKSKSAVK